MFIGKFRPITQCQSNAGDRQSRPQAWAKNIISVGAVAHNDNSNAADDSWMAGGASIGPAEDGRIKPDLSAYNDSTRTTDGATGYGDLGGTSGATPIVAGHVGLALEMWTDGVFGNILPNPGGSRFSNRPHYSTTKALLIASAKPYDFTSGSTDNRREHQGWGFPDLKYLYEMRQKSFVVNESDPLKLLESKSYALRVGVGEPRLSICLTWADPPGNPSDLPTEPERINDLTLKVTSPDGSVYWGNHHLSEGTSSVAGGLADSINTVECVFVSNPIAGRWTLEVSADELLQDGRVETPDEIDADYALVVLGVQNSQPPKLALDGNCLKLHLHEEEERIGTSPQRVSCNCDGSYVEQGKCIRPRAAPTVSSIRRRTSHGTGHQPWARRNGGRFCHSRFCDSPQSSQKERSRDSTDDNESWCRSETTPFRMICQI